MGVVYFGESEWFVLDMDGKYVFHNESFALLAEWLTNHDYDFVVNEDAYDRFEKCHELLLGLIAA